VAAYLILRAFSWQLRLSPVVFEEFAAALFATHPTPLMDEVILVFTMQRNIATAVQHGCMR
jgi:hypothetical protein